MEIQMKAVSEAKAVLRTSVAVLALVCLGQAAIAEDQVTEDPAAGSVEEGSVGLDGFLGEAVTGETVVEEESDCGGCEAWTTFEIDVVVEDEGGSVDGEEGVIEDEVVLADDEEAIVEDEVVLADGEEVIVEDELVLADGEEVIVDGEVVVEFDRDTDGEDLSDCGGCEMQNTAIDPPVFLSSGGPEVQRNNEGDAPAVLSATAGSETAASNSSNACDSGWLASKWICTVQGESWRD